MKKKFAGKLRKKFETRVAGKPVKYEFLQLQGIPQAGDMVIEARFAVGRTTYHYAFDGVRDEASRNNIPVDPTQEMVLGLTLEDLVADLSLSYLRELGVPQEEIDIWLDLSGNLINSHGDFLVQHD